MKRLIILSLIVMGLAISKAQAEMADFWWDTKNYALSYVTTGYFEHIHEGEKEREGAVRIPALAYGRFKLDVFTKFGDSTEYGADFPIKVSKDVSIDPYIAHNISARDVAVGISFIVNLQRFRPW